jgi:hypothetical protein
MKKISIIPGLSALVDDEDFEYLNQWKWYASQSRNTVYATRKQCDFPTTISMHRVILNAPDGVQVDHINGYGLDNRKENLRLCTNAENACNGRLRKNNTSGFRGVTWRNRDKKWRAQITVDGKCISLGLFKDAREAAIAYDQAALKYHGTFSTLNNIIGK